MQVERVLDVCCGDDATVSRWTIGAHTGTHVDAPSHFIKGGKTLAEITLHEWCGPCRVVEIPDRALITIADVMHLAWDDVTKVLFKTDNSLLIDNKPWYERPFNPQFKALSVDAAQFLVQQGITLIGIDYLSVEAYDSQGAPVHHTLLGHDVRIVEGLNLSHVTTGNYQLWCFPIHIDHTNGGDGALARVALQAIPAQ
jgi:arylformamidase